MKHRFLAAALLAAATLVSAPASAQQFFRIGTGGTAGTYYPVGGMIANAVSQPGKIIVTAQASNGSASLAARSNPASASPTSPPGHKKGPAFLKASPMCRACA